MKNSDKKMSINIKLSRIMSLLMNRFGYDYASTFYPLKTKNFSQNCLSIKRIIHWAVGIVFYPVQKIRKWAGSKHEKRRTMQNTIFLGRLNRRLVHR